MNQRFNSHDLWTRVCQEEMPELDESCMTMQRTRKFAKLIVKECAKYVKNTNCFTYASQADLCAERMKQHFGVEE